MAARATRGSCGCFRELGVRFAARDITLRYRQTALGAIWVILVPLLGAGVLSFVFGGVANLQGPPGIPYFVFTLAGMVAWTAFSQVTTRSSGVLVGNSQLVGKVYFPRLLLPLSTVLSTLVDVAVSLALLIVLLLDQRRATRARASSPSRSGSCSYSRWPSASASLPARSWCATAMSSTSCRSASSSCFLPARWPTRSRQCRMMRRYQVRILSSSATIWARPVRVPWPISERAMRMTTVSSGLTTTQALTSGRAVGRLGGAERHGESEREPAGGGGAADQERAAVDFRHVIHGILPAQAFATAAWMPARTCW